MQITMLYLAQGNAMVFMAVITPIWHHFISSMTIYKPKNTSHKCYWTLSWGRKREEVHVRPVCREEIFTIMEKRIGTVCPILLKKSPSLPSPNSLFAPFAICEESLELTVELFRMLHNNVFTYCKVSGFETKESNYPQTVR